MKDCFHGNQSVKRAEGRQVTRCKRSPENVFVKTSPLSDFKNVENKASERTKAIQKIFHFGFLITGVHASVYQKVCYYLLKMKLRCCQGDRLMRGLCRQGSIWMAQRLSVCSDSQMPIKDQRCCTRLGGTLLHVRTRSPVS